MSIQLNDKTNHRREIWTTINQTDLLYVLTKYVADKADVSLDHVAVTHRAYISSRDTSTGHEYECKVEITVDLSE